MGRRHLSLRVVQNSYKNSKRFPIICLNTTPAVDFRRLGFVPSHDRFVNTSPSLRRPLRSSLENSSKREKKNLLKKNRFSYGAASNLKRRTKVDPLTRFLKRDIREAKNKREGGNNICWRESIVIPYGIKSEAKIYAPRSIAFIDIALALPSLLELVLFV